MNLRVEWVDALCVMAWPSERGGDGEAVASAIVGCGGGEGKGDWGEWGGGNLEGGPGVVVVKMGLNSLRITGHG